MSYHQISYNHEEHEIPSGGMRALTPIWDNVGNECDDVVIRCARAFVAACDKDILPQAKGIAKAAQCGRGKVKDHLKEASRRGILSLHLQLPKDEELSHKLAEKYGLAEAVVVLTPTKWNDQASIRAALAPAVMSYFERFCARLRDQQVKKEGERLRIGVDGGRTLYQAVQGVRLHPLPKFQYELTPLVFGPLGGLNFTAATVANMIGIKLEEVGMNVEVKDGFTVEADWEHKLDRRNQVHITIKAACRNIVSHLDLLLVGIGSRKAGLLQREVDRLPREQRVDFFGDILNLAFDRDGREERSVVRRHAVLLNFEDLHRLSQSESALVVGVAGGEDKVDAIRVVLECHYISVLITDRDTAAALVEG